jgi:hypothetical protein
MTARENRSLESVYVRVVLELATRVVELEQENTELRARLESLVR